LAHGHPANFPDVPLLEEAAARRIAGADPLNVAATMDRLGAQGALAGDLPLLRVGARPRRMGYAAPDDRRQP
jgi:hypothetical protein